MLGALSVCNFSGKINRTARNANQLESSIFLACWILFTWNYHFPWVFIFAWVCHHFRSVFLFVSHFYQNWFRRLLSIRSENVHTHTHIFPQFEYDLFVVGFIYSSYWREKQCALITIYSLIDTIWFGSVHKLRFDNIHDVYSTYETVLWLFFSSGNSMKL